MVLLESCGVYTVRAWCRCFTSIYEYECKDCSHQFEALRKVPINEVQSRKEVEDIIRDYIEDAGVRLFLMKNLQRIKEGGFRWKMNLPLLYREYPNIIAGIDTPSEIETKTLFVYGSKSKYIVPSDIKDIQNVFIDSQFAEVDAGHWIHAEKPNELLTLVNDFL